MFFNKDSFLFALMLLGSLIFTTFSGWNFHLSEKSFFMATQKHYVANTLIY